MTSLETINVFYECTYRPIHSINSLFSASPHISACRVFMASNVLVICCRFSRWCYSCLREKLCLAILSKALYKSLPRQISLFLCHPSGTLDTDSSAMVPDSMVVSCKLAALTHFPIMEITCIVCGMHRSWVQSACTFLLASMCSVANLTYSDWSNTQTNSSVSRSFLILSTLFSTLFIVVKCAGIAILGCRYHTVSFLNVSLLLVIILNPVHEPTYCSEVSDSQI